MKIARTLFLCLLSLGMLVSCGKESLDKNKPVYVEISTTMGDVTVMLYDDTPLHRDNFIKLCSENFYEGVLFYMVMMVVDILFRLKYCLIILINVEH